MLLSKKHCDNCYYNDQCDYGEMCEDYTPIGEQAINEEVDDMIENNHVTFRTEWFEYIEDCNS